MTMSQYDFGIQKTNSLEAVRDVGLMACCCLQRFLPLQGTWYCLSHS